MAFSDCMLHRLCCIFSIVCTVKSNSVATQGLSRLTLTAMMSANTEQSRQSEREGMLH